MAKVDRDKALKLKIERVLRNNDVRSTYPEKLKRELLELVKDEVRWALDFWP